MPQILQFTYLELKKIKKNRPNTGEKPATLLINLIPSALFGFSLLRIMLAQITETTCI